MTTLEKATEKICELKGSVMALDTLLVALVRVLPPEACALWAKSLAATVSVAETVLLNADVSDVVIDSFSSEILRWQRLPAFAAPKAAFTASPTASVLAKPVALRQKLRLRQKERRAKVEASRRITTLKRNSAKKTEDVLDLR